MTGSTTHAKPVGPSPPYVTFRTTHSSEQWISVTYSKMAVCILLKKGKICKTLITTIPRIIR